MKKIYLLLILLITTLSYSQKQGISYQAVILNPNLELPGYNDNSNVLANQELEISFSIFGSSNNLDFRETHMTSTDKYGMINLVIGSGKVIVGEFQNIKWDGKQKTLKVDVDLGSGFVELSTQELLYLPYDFHNEINSKGNIKSGGDISAEGDINTSSNLIVEGDVTVGGDLITNKDLIVEGNEVLDGDIIVDGNLDVLKSAKILDSLYIGGYSEFGGATNFNKTVIIKDSLVVNENGRIIKDFHIQGSTGISKKLAVKNKISTSRLAVTDTAKFLGPFASKRISKIDSISSTIIESIDVKVTKNLNVDGNTNLKNLVVDGNITANDITIIGNETIDDDLTIKGNLKINQQVEIDQTLNIKGATTLDQNLNVLKDVNITGSLSAAGLKSSNDIESDTNLHIKGTSKLDKSVTINDSLFLKGILISDDNANFKKIEASKSINIGKNLDVKELTSLKTLNVSGDTNISGKTKINNELEVSGAASFSDIKIDGTLNVSGIEAVESDFNVNGDVTFGGNLKTSGQTDLEKTKIASELTVEGNSILNGITIQGDANLDSNLTVLGNSNFEDISSNGSISSKKNLEIDGMTYLKDIGISGNSTISGTLSVKDSVSISDKLNVDGELKVGALSTLQGVHIKKNVTIDEALNVGTASSFGGNVLMSEDVEIAGNFEVKNDSKFKSTQINDSLIVDGISKLAEIEVTKDADIKGELNVSGDTKLQKINIAENGIFDKNLTVNGDTSLVNLKVSAETTFLNKLLVEEEADIKFLKVTDSVNINKDLRVEKGFFGNTINTTGPATFDNSVNITGATTLGGTLDITGNTTVNDLYVLGTLRIKGNEQVDGDLTVGGNESVKGNEKVGGYLEIDGYLKALNDFVVNGKADFNDRTTMLKTLVAKDSTIVNNLISSGPMTLNSTLTSNSDVEFKGSTFKVDSAAKFTSNLTVLEDTDLQKANISSANISETLNVDGNTNLKDVNIAKSAIVLGELKVDGETKIAGISVAKNGNFSKDLTVSGDTDLQKVDATDADISGELTVMGNTILQGINVGQDASVSGQLTVSGDTDLQKVVTTDTNIKGELTVSGDTNLSKLEIISTNDDKDPVIEITTKKKGIEIKMAKEGRIDKSHTYIEFTSNDGKLGEIRASLYEEILTNPLELWEYYNLVQKEADKTAELAEIVADGLKPVKVVGYEEALAKMVLTFTGEESPVVGPALPFGGGNISINTAADNGTFSGLIKQSEEMTFEINEGALIEAEGTATGVLAVTGEATGEATVISDVIGGGIGPIEGVAEGFGVSVVEGVAEVVVEGEATGEGFVTAEVTGEAEGELTVNLEEGEISGNIAIAGIQSTISDVTIEYPFKLTELNNAYVPSDSRFLKAAKEVSEASAKLATYTKEKMKDGVVYESGNADYAEWLPKKNENEKFLPGDIVSVNKGKVSKNTNENGNSKMLIISSLPMMLGNKPKIDNNNYEMVAFMGQVPVKMRGNVFAGDYIIPSGFNDGSGIAISDYDIKPEQYSQIVGVAWSSSINQGISYVNASVGLNSNDVAKLAMIHDRKIKLLEKKVNNLNNRLVKIEEEKNIKRSLEFEMLDVEKNITNKKDSLEWNEFELVLSFLKQMENKNIINEDIKSFTNLLLTDHNFSKRFFDFIKNN